MKSKLNMIVVAACLVAGAVAVQAEPGKRKLGAENKRTVQQTFNRIDANKDGKVSAEEWVTHVKDSSFKKLDADKNGSVSKAEWDVLESGEDAEARFARWDKNADGKLSKQEFRDTPNAREVIMRLFRTVDRNKDNDLVIGEFLERADDTQ